MATTTAEALLEARALEAPLSVELAYYAEHLRKLAPAVAEGYDKLVSRLVAGDVGASAPQIGEELPPFLLPSETGHLVDSADILSRGPVIISFNRGHWCPFCRLEVAALARASAEIGALGGHVLAITPEKAALNKKLRGDAKAPFMILSDTDNAYALQLGLVMRIDDELRELLFKRGLDLSKFQPNDNWLLPIPATFAVDAAGVVRGRFIDPDFRRRTDMDQILAVLRGIGLRA